VLVYLDATALVKRYVAEVGSDDVAGLIASASAVATSLLSRVEVVAALANAARLKVIRRREAGVEVRRFDAEWESIIRLQLSETLAGRAAGLAWEHGLRDCDATHLASALLWQDVSGAPVTVATYDRPLWHAVTAAGLTAWPERLP
jgi:predicted nucleic acid-binding protein